MIGSLGCAGCARPPSSSDPPVYLGGIQVNEPDHDVWLKALRKAGLDTVETTVYAKQGNWDTAHLWWAQEEPAVEAEIRRAKEAGLKVVLILRVALDHAYPKNRFLWHGMVSPRSNAALDAWFLAYGQFVNLWARKAQALGVDVLAIGSEMSALTSTRPRRVLSELLRFYLEEEPQVRFRRELLRFGDQIQPRHWNAAGGRGFSDLRSFLVARSEAWHRWAEGEADPDGDGHPTPDGLNARRKRLERHWRELIRETRTHYSGPITYAANFDQYQDVGFWDALDLIGVNAYFRLRDPESRTAPTREVLRAGWTRVLRAIDTFRRTEGLASHRVLFTELGYVARKNCTLQPWSQAGFDVLGPPSQRALFIWEDQPPDQEERAHAVEALSAALTDFPGMFAGALYWKLSSRPEHEAIEPFVVTLGKTPRDPLLPALVRLGRAP